ncbi:hypothetical protein C7410_115152 [Paraburkholderia silvatlantica]|uniref:Uncharacterized protein n=2 Tax=Paraburkholderia silvatlantica TaxID=321895 RepID=A0A2V4T700_9BURK|nr:hypothetical protein C7410_115152 [Paraburkholderia silvatlantica]TDQ86550.1 hypothetical protein C7412_11745 [Paraburkholderia silvatlantica]
MSSKAFDELLSRLEPEDRDRIREMAIAYGLTFDDPSWIPFAITQMTLDELQDQVGDASAAMKEAADLALRRIGNSARATCNQVQAVMETQSKAVEELRSAILDIERASLTECRAALARLSDQHIGQLIDDSTDGIVQDMVERLTGEEGLLVGSATRHSAALDEAGQKLIRSIDAAVARIDDASRRAAASMWRAVRNTGYVAIGTIALSTVLMARSVVFFSTHHDMTGGGTSQACSAPKRAEHNIS